MATSFLTRSQRLLLLKIFALLSLVRWYNILLIAVSQYLTALFILNNDNHKLDVLLDYRLLLISTASAFLIAGGYIINSFYDLEKDLVNNPRKIIFEKYISKWFSLNCYFLFSFIGLLLSYFVGLKILIFNGVFLFLLWLYSHKLKKITIVGNISATVLSIIPFFSICIYYNEINSTILLYVSFIFLVEMTRELMKDLEAIKGDVIFGYQTIPVALGVNKTKKFAYLLITLTFVPAALILLHNQSVFINIYFVISLTLLAFCVFRIRSAKTSAGYHQINTIYKAIILFGIGSIIFY